MTTAEHIATILGTVLCARTLADITVYLYNRHKEKKQEKTEGKQMTAKEKKEKIIRAIQDDIDDAEIGLSDCDNAGVKAFHQGRIFAHKYDLLVIKRILKEEEK